MTSISEMAEAYKATKLRNIVELQRVSCDIQAVEETFPGKDGEWTALCIEEAGEKYRVPTSVLAKLKALKEVKPKMKAFRVIKTGEGLNTDYSVVDVE